MADHYCMEHHTVFFKKGGMRGFAHPIDGGGWCNEEGGETNALEGTKPPEQRAAKDEPDTGRPVDPTRKSIERQTSLKSAVEWCMSQNVAGKDLKVTDVIAAASLFESYLENGVTVKKP